MRSAAPPVGLLSGAEEDGAWEDDEELCEPSLSPSSGWGSGSSSGGSLSDWLTLWEDGSEMLEESPPSFSPERRVQSPQAPRPSTSRSSRMNTIRRTMYFPASFLFRLRLDIAYPHFRPCGGTAPAEDNIQASAAGPPWFSYA